MREEKEARMREEKEERRKGREGRPEGKLEDSMTTTAQRESCKASFQLTG